MSPNERRLKTAFQKAISREAIRTLQIGYPVMAGIFLIEGISHIVETPEALDLILFPICGALLLLILCGIFLKTKPSRPSWWLLIPWALIIVSTIQHLFSGSAVGAVLFLASTLIGVGAIIMALGPLIVALIVTTATLTLAAHVAFAQSPWIYPVFTLLMALLMNLPRRRVLWESEHHRLVEQALAQKQSRLENLERSRALTAGVAHHFNNLLTVILAGSEFVRDEISQEAPRALKDLDLIAQAGRRAANIVEEMVAYAGKANVTVAPLTIPRLLQNARDKLSPTDIPIHQALDPALPIIHGDDRMLSEALAHVLHNAVEASSPGQTPIWIRAQLTENGAVCLQIADNGPGFTPDILDRIFEPFFTTKAPTRAGLGLPFAQGVIEQHGGTITATNHPGSGAQVTITLPTSPPEESANREDRLSASGDGDPGARAVWVKRSRPGVGPRPPGKA